ncbi:hypothetical protein Cni_G17814 [Canna indica]|uniref:Uncharacterized protein n=1 Tax=Canna indica TaxID=4628 RepID=A0AAQ3QGY3_9LILI|nr:hypothetical protein Cni_G17814 [Canna indica]
MEALRRLVSAATKSENVVSALLLGSFAALAFHSSEQQCEIDALEAEKASIRAAVSTMSSTMWACREDLFALASAADDPSSSSPQQPSIPLSRLRAIYGEEEPPSPSSPPPSASGEVAARESISIA